MAESASARAARNVVDASTHPANCLCCIGGPDLSFERAVFALLELNLGLEYDTAARFVRLCRAAPRMVLSKGKTKLAAKVRGKDVPALEAEDVRRAQDAVLGAYAATLALEETQRASTAARTNDGDGV